MLLLAQELSIHLEVVDAAEAPVAGIDARLRQLTHDHAVAIVSSKAHIPCLRLGSNVRFDVGDGDDAYTLLGSVVGSSDTCDPIRALDTADTGVQSKNSSRDDVSATSISIRIWNRRRLDQRRATPRRYIKLPVQWLTLTDQPGTDSPRWNDGVCIDMGGGGMRLLTSITRPYPSHISLRFSLRRVDEGIGCSASDRCLQPGAAELRSAVSNGGAKLDQLELQGRVLRIKEPDQSQRQCEMAVRFEALSVEHGMALSRYLSDQP